MAGARGGSGAGAAVRELALMDNPSRGMTRRLLLVTYHFPPSAASGTFRMLGFTRHLPHFGWRVHVVAPPPLGRVFASDHGIIFNAIRPDKVMDFEMVLAKLRDALANSKDPVRQQQGWGWKIYKQTEPGPNGSVLYVFVMDPAVKGADYGVAKILAEAYPTEIMELYRMYIGAFATALAAREQSPS